MKPLKKHPKQQRMEEMTFPIIKPSRLVHKDTLSAFGDLDQDVQKDMLRSVRAIRKEKVLYSGELKTRKVTNEEMTFPITKPLNLKGFKSKAVPIFKESAADDNYIIKNSVFIANINDVPPGDHKIIWQGNLIPVTHKEKVTMTGREYLRSINDDLGFTLLPRIVWRVVAVVVFVGAVIYFLSKYGYIR